MWGRAGRQEAGRHDTGVVTETLHLIYEPKAESETIPGMGF